MGKAGLPPPIRRFVAQVFLEPRARLVQGAGFLIISILEIFDLDRSCVIVPDATVNHMPEVLRSNYSPNVIEQLEDGSMVYQTFDHLSHDEFNPIGQSITLEGTFV